MNEEALRYRTMVIRQAVEAAITYAKACYVVMKVVMKERFAGQTQRLNKKLNC